MPTQLDILVIGGGVHGAAIAWEATLRGLSVALIDKGDFGGGASAGNYRIIHGGLRYLQHADLIRLFESVEEQRVFRIIAPEAVAPLPFLIPCYGTGMRGRAVLNAGLTLYDVLTFWRNIGMRPKDRLPNHRLLSPAEVLAIAPHLEQRDLRGGIVFYDVQMLAPDRLTLSFILSAEKRGAIVRNYCEAIGAEISKGALGGRIDRVRCRNTLTGEEVSFAAKLVVNAAGTWRSAVASTLIGSATEPFVFSKGLQLTFPALTGEHAVVLESKFRDSTAYVAKGNRSYFLQPWNGVTIAGTADILHTADPESYRLSEEEISLFVQELADLYPDPRITRANVLAAFGGLRPVTPSVRHRQNAGKLGDYGSIEVAHRDTIVVHANSIGDLQAENLISVEGIKYTTTRRLAERIVNIGVRLAGISAGPSLSKSTPLDFRTVGADPSDEEIGRIVREEHVEKVSDLIERRLGYTAHTPPTSTLLDRCKRIFDSSKGIHRSEAAAL